MNVCCSDGVRNTVSTPSIEMAVHRRELELVLEVRDGAQAADDRLEAVRAGELDGEPRVARDRDLGQVAQHFAARARRARRARTAAPSCGFDGDRDDDAVEQAHATAHQILVPAGDRVERAGIHGADFHVREPALRSSGIVASAL